MRKALVNNNISRIRKKRVAHLLTPFPPESLHRSHDGDTKSIEYRATLSRR
ncbi:hypothetical protein [Streptomyces chartreusis]|uniref:hypothetical protein n=1 Tax=Streptomyces chartreusis TaxID=1969 RepID=UPI00380AE895